MDRIFLNILLIGPFGAILLFAASILVGGIIASRFVTVRVSHRRVTYFWLSAVIFCAFTALQLGSELLSNAVRNGFFVPLCIFLALTFPLYGAFIYFTSAARSNHIAGDTSLAWLGFIPVANLWLLLKPGRADPHHIWLEHGVRDIFIVAAALLPIGLGNEIIDELNETSVQARTLYAFEEVAPTVEAAAYYKALDFGRSNKPSWIQGVVLRYTEADEEILRLHYVVPPHSVDSFDPNIKREQAFRMCNSLRNQKFLNDGGQFLLEFENRDGSSLGELSITSTTCAR